MKKKLSNLKKHLLTGTSHMIPFIVAGGVLYSIAVMLNPSGAGAPKAEDGILIYELAQIGNAGLKLFIPVLGAYIAYSIADKPGLAPGMCGAWLAQSIDAGFLGGIAAGFIAGAIVYQLKKIRLPISLKSLGSIFLYPLIGTFITGIIILGFIGPPLSILMDFLTEWLSKISDQGLIPLGAILGSMTAFDMGGPINKVSTLFAQTQVNTLPYLMGGVGVSICVPPIGMGIATLLSPKKYSDEEKQAGKAALLMGCVGITEGAIPFAANDPIRVIPSICVGAAVGNITAFLLGVLNHAPWGGFIVLPVIEGKLYYIISILIGALITAFMVNLLKKNEYKEEKEEVEDIELLFEEIQ